MLPRLRLDGFIGSHYQQYKVDPRRAGQHIAEESFVARHIQKAESHSTFFQKRKAEIDRDPAALFFFESVRVRAGEGLDERRLAMIDVTGRADDDAFQSWSHLEGPGRPRAIQTRDATGASREGQTSETGGRYSAAASSSRMACVAARGSPAARIGRPTTMKSAPARTAWDGGAVRAWSSTVLDLGPFAGPGFRAGRTPGVTIRKSRPQTFRMAFVSCAEATTPSTPARFAISASLT